MAYSDTQCSKCGRELRTRNPSAEIHMCSACWAASKRGEPKRQLVKLKEAIERAKATISPKPRGTHHDKEYNDTRKQTPTHREAGQLRRIYGK